MKTKKKVQKPRGAKLEKKLAVTATFEDLIKITTKKFVNKAGS